MRGPLSDGATVTGSDWDAVAWAAWKGARVGRRRGDMASFPFSILGNLASRAAGSSALRFEFGPARDAFKLPRTSQGSRHGGSLAKMVESEIIPRLMLAHQALQPTPEASNDTRARLGEETTDRFARMVLAKDSDSLIVFVGMLLRDGISMEQIFLDLLVPAARRLGDYWNDDSASFVDVTIGLSRLQQVVRALGYENPADDDVQRPSPAVLFAPAPGEQHTFGLFIIEESFRRSGWRTWIETSPKKRDLADTAGAHWFDLFGLSASKDTQPEAIADLVGLVRKTSRNAGLFVMVGGRLFVEQPDLIKQVGADAYAADGGEALLIANETLLIANNEIRRVATGS